MGKSIMPEQVDKKEFLKTISKELHRRAVKKFRRSKVISDGIDDIWSADLVDMQEFKDDNFGYRYLLTVIDVFSRFAWAIPLKTKTASEVRDQFDVLFDLNDKRAPRKLWTDQGTEFYNKDMDKLLKLWNVKLYSTYGEHKASLVERFNRTLKTLMWKKFTAKSTHNWVDLLDRLVTKYNHTIHSSLFGLTPEKAHELKGKKEDRLWEKQYSDAVEKSADNREHKFNIGDWVRTSRVKGIFEKGYTANWTAEMFRIIEIVLSDPTRYKLQDYYGKSIEGSFYDQELQKVKYQDLWLVDKVLGERKVKGKKQIHVSYVGMPAKYNEWIDFKSTTALK